VLFQSAAASFCERAIAVVLTGMDSDGAAGVQAIKNMGGIVIAQDQATSEFFAMPQAAIRTGVVDFILPLDAIAPALIDLIKATCIYKSTKRQPPRYVVEHNSFE
jgi:two-component system chemotaxis response regulator CheB